MLMYLIIILELAFLYAAFWYIYLREPKPRKITGNPWGNYASPITGKQYATRAVDPSLPPIGQPVLIDKQPGTRTWQVQNPGFTNIVPATARQSGEAQLVVDFLSNLKQSVNRLSVKLP